jgi:RNA polymerase sigma factor for flagellar operon FliA
MTPEQLFLAQLPLIKKVVAHTCRRCRLKKEDAEELLSEVVNKIMADDYAVLRKFEGKSPLKGYLATVVKNQMRDFQNRLWGKWRHSEMAKRLGPVAMHLEKLVRDGYTFNETVQILRTNHKVEMSWQELNEIAARLPPRTPRHMEGEEVLESLPSSGNRPDAGIVEEEKSALRVRALEALQKALKSVPAEDQVILKMQQWNHFTVAQISRVLKLEQKPLYRRIEKTLEHLKREMERQGIRKEDIDDLFDE